MIQYQELLPALFKSKVKGKIIDIDEPPTKNNSDVDIGALSRTCHTSERGALLGGVHAWATIIF